MERHDALYYTHHIFGSIAYVIMANEEHSQDIHEGQGFVVST